MASGCFSSKLEEVGRIDIGAAGLKVLHMIDFTSDYAYAAVAHPSSGNVAVIRTADRKIVATLATGPGTHMATVRPQGGEGRNGGRDQCFLFGAVRRTSGDRSIGIEIPFELQLRGDLVRGNCRTEQETLTLLAAQGLQELKLFLRFNALGKRHQAQAVADIDDRPEYFCGPARCFDILDEGSVNLDLVERKTAQISQSAIAGAKIIQGNGHAELLQVLQDLHGFGCFFQEAGFGDFKLEPVGSET